MSFPTTPHHAAHPRFNLPHSHPSLTINTVGKGSVFQQSCVRTLLIGVALGPH